MLPLLPFRARRLTLSRSLAGLGMLLLCTACGQPVVLHPGPHTDLEASAANVAPAPYHIGIGDQMDVKFFYTPELNEQIQVRPDGKISIMFAQDIDAVGRTPEDLARIIKEQLAPHLNQLDLVVVMRSFVGQRVYVGGEVTKPGPVALAGREKLLQVLDEAGWITPAGKRDEVVLVRAGADGKEAIYALNIDKIISGEDLSQNIVVNAGDQILVPPSDATAFDRWIDRNIRQALPFSSSVFYSIGGNNG